MTAIQEATPEVGMAPPPEDPQDRIATARVMIGNPAHWAQARSLLEEVVSDARGTRYASEALDLLLQLPPPEPLRDEVDPEIEKRRDEWLAIHGPFDGRLVSFLDRLRQHPAAIARLLSEMAGDLRQWIVRQTHELKRARETENEVCPDPRQLAAMTELVDTLSGIKRFAEELRPEIQHYRDERYGLRLRELRPEIRSACAAWSIDRAWELRKEFAGTPNLFDREVRELEEAIYAADELRTEVERALDQLVQPAPEDWPELRLTLEAIDRAQRYLGKPEVPEPWQEKLRSATDALAETALRFLVEGAGQAATLDALRTFWDQYQHLQPSRRDPRLAIRPAWFEAPLAHLREELTARVRESPDAGHLEAEAQRFELDLVADLRTEPLVSVPPPVCERCLPWVEQINHLVDGWRAMQEGRFFTAPAEMELSVPAMLPAAFECEVERYQRLLTEVAAGFELLERPGTPPREARAAALAVLEEVPDHAEAARLAARAESQALHQELDAHLERWEVEVFLALTRDRSPGHPYRDLLTSPQPLLALVAQARESRLTSTHEAADWWRAWQSARQQLPAEQPAALERAIDRHQARRREEWGDALEELLAQDPSPDLCRAAAESLSETLAEPELKRYHRDLRRREVIGRIGQLLAEGRWPLASRQLQELPHDDPERRRLDILRAVGEARSAGVTQVAAVLHERWVEVVASCGEEAYTVLGTGLEQAWHQRETETLQRLEEVARRVARDGDAPASVRARIADWLEWLQIERQLAGGLSASGIRQLVRYLEKPPPSEELVRRCRALVEHWREADDVVALAWAYRALVDCEPPLFPGMDPLETLVHRSDTAANEVLQALREGQDLELEDLAAMQETLRPLARDWQDLDDFLNLLPRIPDRQAPPERFHEAGTLLDGLSQTLRAIVELERCDLRRDAARSRWNGARLALVQDLRELPVATQLLERLERLVPLTLLNFAEQQIRKAAQRCARGEPEILDEPELFAALANRIRELIGEFEKTEMVGGAMWQIVSQEYWSEVPAAAGDLATPAGGEDLVALAARCDQLEAEEKRFRQALGELKQHEPYVGADGSFDPARHADYLALYPAQGPTSRRVYRLFDRFSRVEPRPTILSRSGGRLPPWIVEYLQEGVP